MVCACCADPCWKSLWGGSILGRARSQAPQTRPSHDRERGTRGDSLGHVHHAVP
jgi:hypothetical protein